MKVKQYRPFSNATEFMMWQDKNCYKCKKYESESKSEAEAGCKLAFNLDLSSVLDGTIPEWVADEIGTTDKHSQIYKKKKIYFCELSECKMKS